MKCDEMASERLNKRTRAAEFLFPMQDMSRISIGTLFGCWRSDSEVARWLAGIIWDQSAMLVRDSLTPWGHLQSEK